MRRDDVDFAPSSGVVSSTTLKEDVMTDKNVGRFVWYDLLTTDTGEAIAFYADVVGWKSQAFGPEYTLLVGGQGPGCGAAKLPMPGAPPHWTSNVHVADVDATIARVKELGGKILSEPKDFPNVGRLAVIADPQGNAINVFKPQNPMTLPDTSKPGYFTWNELLTKDHETAFRFYSTLFGWEKKRDFDMGPMGKYLIYGTPDKELGGMMTAPKGAPSAWGYYVEVADLDGAIARAKAKGATVLNGPMEVPGGARIVQLKDPQGAFFALHENKKG
jgi:predicted enzyme related to lactoylglutathione lyase